MQTAILKGTLRKSWAKKNNQVKTNRCISWRQNQAEILISKPRCWKIIWRRKVNNSETSILRELNWKRTVNICLYQWKELLNNANMIFLIARLSINWRINWTKAKKMKKRMNLTAKIHCKRRGSNIIIRKIRFNRMSRKRSCKANWGWNTIRNSCHTAEV